MTKKNNGRNVNSTQPKPASGSHRVKNGKHSRQKHHAHHDM
ncbi:small acid-soluble spore protein P [Peribacillus kribbensis]|nr:small acid-soluble spore protein P [Peribacillus kribbensis]